MSSQCLTINNPSSLKIHHKRIYIPSPISIATSTSTTTTTTGDNDNEKVNLIEKLNKNHKTIVEARNEYLNEYKNFVSIAYKFYDEKYLNLKLKFKNQILKQQIYFESELYDLSKECQRDYDYHVNKLKLDYNSNSNSNNLYKKIKNVAENYIKLCKVSITNRITTISRLK